MRMASLVEAVVFSQRQEPRFEENGDLKPTAYISGPMRGIADGNFPAFDAAEARLYEAGWNVISPANLDRHYEGPAETPHDYAERDLSVLLVLRPEKDVLVVLKDWYKSRGAIAEVAVANWLSVPIKHFIKGAPNGTGRAELEPVSGGEATRPEVVTLPRPGLHPAARAMSEETETPDPDGGKAVEPPSVRIFDTGATRDTDNGKLDYEGFLSPLALRRYAEYMHKHRVQADGSLRDSDNWQKGIPAYAYMKSMWRHFMDVWGLSREAYPHVTPEPDGRMEEALCGLFFNVQGLLHEAVKARLGVAALQKEGE